MYFVTTSLKEKKSSFTQWPVNFVWWPGHPISQWLGCCEAGSSRIHKQCTVCYCSFEAQAVYRVLPQFWSALASTRCAIKHCFPGGTPSLIPQLESCEDMCDFFISVTLWDLPVLLCVQAQRNKTHTIQAEVRRRTEYISFCNGCYSFI